MIDLKTTKVLVCGDVMLDEYWFGDASRISPEAPVPVVKIEHMDKRLGGASNVCLNISKLGAACTIVSLIGDDNSGQLLTSLINENNIASNLIIDKEFSTIQKLRVIARNQQLLRVDFEVEPSDSATSRVLNEFHECLTQHNVVVLSDYCKGTLQLAPAMIAEARRFNIPVLVDPKGLNWSKYRDCTIITPNKAELRAVVGPWYSEIALRKKAQALRENLNIRYLLLTRSEEGMTLFGPDIEMDFKAQAKEVFDVSGAGDTVIAVLATLIGSGFDLIEAIRLANKAGGIVVGKFGTAPVTYDELFN